MNIKKIAITAAAGAVMLGAAMPAFASHWDLIIKIKNKDTTVTNNVTTKANTGKNNIIAWDDVDGGKIKTGNADALSAVINDVNYNQVDVCDCLGDFDDVLIKIKNKNTDVTNNVTTKANTGKNNIISEDDDVEGGKIKTGNAGAGGVVTNFVNTNIVGDGS